jgi:hypothetical protein
MPRDSESANGGEEKKKQQNLRKAERCEVPMETLLKLKMTAFWITVQCSLV